MKNSWESELVEKAYNEVYTKVYYYHRMISIHNVLKLPFNDINLKDQINSVLVILIDESRNVQKC